MSTSPENAVVKIKLSKSAALGEILQCIEQVEATKIVFVCASNLALLAEVAVIKKIKEQAEECAKELIFVSSQRFSRDTLKKYELVCFSAVPVEFKDLPFTTIDQVLAPEQLTVDDRSEDEHDAEEDEEGGKNFPQFELKRITRTPTVSRAQVFFFLLVTVGFVLLLNWWFAPKAIITMKSKIEAVPFIQNVIVVFPEHELPDENQDLPRVKGIFVRTQVEDEEVITAGGRRYDVTNARGKITLYNETTEEKYLVPSRLRASGGVIVRFKKPVTIPPRTEEGPGAIVVAVEADAYDEDERPIGGRGNISAGTEFTFPALRDELQELYYGRANKGPLVGGSTLTHYVVLEEDEESAKEVLLDSFRYRGIEALKEEVAKRSKREGGSQFLLQHPTLLRSEVLEYVFPTEKIGQEHETFTVAGKVEVAGIVFDQGAIKDILEDRISSTLDERQKLVHLDESSIDYELLSSEAFMDEKWIKLSVKVVGVEQLDADSKDPKVVAWRQELKNSIVGKDRDKARSILINNPEIEDVLDIEIDPPWSQSLPADPEEIKFRVQRVGTER